MMLALFHGHRGHGFLTRRWIGYTSVLVVLFSAIQAAIAAQRPNVAAAFVTVSGTQFMDSQRRALILHGINVSNKNSAEHYTGDLGDSDFAAIRSWGMNCIRLTIFWDGLEPAPGKIDEAYLERIFRLVQSAKAHQLYVLLDMHQDLYSVKFSDGAPAWATLDEGKKHTTGATWSDAYRDSMAVQTAFDNFWRNAPGPDGLGLQDHYARVWQAVAKRFASEPAVVGYDLMNEPAPGADWKRSQEAARAALLHLLAKRHGPSAPTAEKLAAITATPEGSKQLGVWLQDRDVFAGMLDAAAPLLQDFERTRLQPFYARVARAIREVDRHHILFLEPQIGANVGIRTAIAPLSDNAGHREPQQAFAPHVYDITTDRSQAGLSSNARVQFMVERIAQAGRQLQMPMIIGEWGAYYLDPSAVEPARFLISQFHSLHCGDTYWSYGRKLAQSPLLHALSRSIEN
jgi:endoglycosylceramidase